MFHRMRFSKWTTQEIRRVVTQNEQHKGPYRHEDVIDLVHIIMEDMRTTVYFQNETIRELERSIVELTQDWR